MTPVDQLCMRTETQRGDCWRACIASLLDLPCSEVPHFVQECEETCENYEEETKEWLSKRGFFMGRLMIATREGDARTFLLRRSTSETVEIQSGHIIVCGDGPRDCGHAVIGDVEKFLKVGFRANPRGDEGDDYRLWMAHDPHPSRDGLLTWHTAYAIVPA